VIDISFTSDALAHADVKLLERVLLLLRDVEQPDQPADIWGFPPLEETKAGSEILREQEDAD
jgi:hypothetical protein